MTLDKSALRWGASILAVALLESLHLIKSADDRRAHLRRLIEQLRAGLAPLCTIAGWRLLHSDTAIQPLVIGGNQESLDLAEALLVRGIWAPAIRPPTVPLGQARLRISLSASHTTAQVDRLLAALGEIAACAS